MKNRGGLKSALASAVALALGVTSAHAATIAVTSTDDNFHFPTCNLRNAVASFRLGTAQGACAIALDGSDNTIVFAPDLVNSTITLQRGELAVGGAITLQGSGQTIDADYGSRVFYVKSASLTLKNLTVQHGYAGGTGRGGSGAGVYVYSGNLELDNVTVKENFALGDGGGINVFAGVATLSHSTISANTALGGSGGISMYGTATIDNSTVSGNTGSKSGGIAITSGYSSDGYSGSTIGSIVTIARSTIDGNTAQCTASLCAGGIYANIGNFVTFDATTISNNQASGAFDKVAGGIYAYDSVLTLRNSTIASNSADGNNDVTGALWHTGTSYGASSMTGTTIVGNSATTLNASATVRSGILLGYNADSRFAMRNSIIAGNVGGTDFGMSGTTETMTSCIVGTIASGTRFNVDPTNTFSDTPGLGPLQFNGGPARTMSPQVGSIAIDAGNNAFATTN